MTMTQLDMFLPDAICELQAKFEKVEKTATQVRKGLFARNTGIEKRLTEQDDIIAEMQREIYNLKKKIYEQPYENIVQLKAM